MAKNKQHKQPSQAAEQVTTPAAIQQPTEQELLHRDVTKSAMADSVIPGNKMAINEGKIIKQQHHGDATEAAIGAVMFHNIAQKHHVHHQQGGIILHCDDSDCEDDLQHEEVAATLDQHQDHFSEFVPDSAASSSGVHRHRNEILSTMHPMRQEIVGASDDIRLDTEHSSVQGMNCGQSSQSPWLANNGNFLDQKKPLKMDLLLPQIQISMENNILRLEESDYIPVSIGWGFSLLGLFGGRFPGKDAVNNLTKRWKFPARVSFHPKGWIIFRFETEEQANAVLRGGPYSVFGIQLALSHLPPDFRFDSTPELQFKVWATLPNLPLELWNASAISKIASVAGTPLEVDPYTLSKHNVAGPRVLIMVDAKKEPLDSITLQLHNGISFSQSIILDYYPFFCTRCKRAGHLASSCRAPEHTNLGTRLPPRNHFKSNAENGGWQVVKNRKNRIGRSRSRLPANRPHSRPPTTAPPRSKSRPPQQQWQPKTQAQHTAASPRNEVVQPQKITNTHIYFDSPTSEQNGIDLSNKFQAFDDLEQIEEAATLHQHTHNRPLHVTSALPKNQPLQQAISVNKIGSPAAPNLLLETSKACDQSVAPTLPPTDAALIKNNKNKEVMYADTGAVPANDTAAAPASARYTPPPVRFENTVHQRLNSTDTSSTECILIKNTGAANTNDKDREPSKATISAPAAHDKQGTTTTYLNVLTSPPNRDVTAGDKLNLNKQKLKATVLDPRNAYKKKTTASTLPPTDAAGRALIQTNLKKRK